MDETKVIELLGKNWWGIMLIGLIIYVIGLQRFFGDWWGDPIACAIIQSVGIIFMIIGFLQFRKKWNNYKKGIKVALWILFVIVIISCLLGICYMWNKKPPIDSIEAQHQLEETITPMLTFTPQATSTLIPTLTPTPQYIPAAMAMQKYYEDINASNNLDLDKLYEFQNKCSKYYLGEFKYHWLRAKAKYIIYGCPGINTLDVHISYYDRSYENFSKSFNETGEWIRYVLGNNNETGWEIVECDDSINSYGANCKYFASN